MSTTAIMVISLINEVAQTSTGGAYGKPGNPEPDPELDPDPEPEPGPEK